MLGSKILICILSIQKRYHSQGRIQKFFEGRVLKFFSYGRENLGGVLGFFFKNP